MALPLHRPPRAASSRRTFQNVAEKQAEQGNEWSHHGHLLPVLGDEPRAALDRPMQPGRPPPAGPAPEQLGPHPPGWPRRRPRSFWPRVGLMSPPPPAGGRPFDGVGADSQQGGNHPPGGQGHARGYGPPPRCPALRGGGFAGKWAPCRGGPGRQRSTIETTCLSYHKSNTVSDCIITITRLPCQGEGDFWEGVGRWSGLDRRLCPAGGAGAWVCRRQVGLLETSAGWNLRCPRPVPGGDPGFL